MRMKSSLMLKQLHTKTSPPRVYCKQTAPKLLYVGVKVRVIFHIGDPTRGGMVLLVPYIGLSQCEVGDNPLGGQP